MDFAGMSVMPDVLYETAPTSEELAHGLGGAPDHTLAKLELLMEHERSVMASLARFVAAGNSLVVVRGNHDVDWHWEPVQEAFRKGLLAHAPFPEQQLEFAPWFYYEEGLVFIEHGHQYDPYCSFEHVLHPVSPFDPRRTMRSLSDVLLRYVVRPTRGMTEAGHAAAGILTYLRFAFGLGARGMLLLAKRFVAATRALIDLWREHVSDATEWVRSEQERKLAALGRLHRIQLDRLRGLLRLQRPPITKSLLALLASVMLDRVLLGALGVVAVFVVLLSVEPTAVALAVVAAVVFALVGLGAAWRRLRDTLEPSAELRERSALVARLFPAAFIVMGHTHLPEKQPTTEHATYVNLGAWAEDEVEDGLVPNLPATRTHLLVTRVEDRPVAELLTWHPTGPLPYGNTATKGRSEVS
jgi:UDP-2,3-diacylglucosamine pyrophosphatase LpxH